MTVPTGSSSTGQGLMSADEAGRRILAAIAGPLAAELVPTADALGRVPATAVVSRTALPPWNNSAMDGYAIRATDTAGASEAQPVRLRIVGEVRAGTAPTAAGEAGTALRIATGAPLPSGADAVVPVEETTPIDRNGIPGSRGREAVGPLPDACLVHLEVSAGSSVRLRSSDLGDSVAILPSGRELTAAGIGLAAGAGVSEVLVHRRPRVAVLATGDEVRPAGTALGPAGIPDANGPGLRALARAAGADVVDLGIAADRLADVLVRLRRGIAESDVVIVSGGVSVGPYDVVRLAFESVGRVDLWRVAVQPGKPFAFALAERTGGAMAERMVGEVARRTVGDVAGQTGEGVAAGPGSAAGPERPVLLFGLPGNPVSSFVTFELFVRPALRKLAGHGTLGRPLDRAVLTEPVTKGHGRRAFLRVVAERDAADIPVRDDRGRVRVGLAGGQGSHVLSALAAADALVVIPEADDALPAGAEVALWWLDRG